MPERKRIFSVDVFPYIKLSCIICGIRLLLIMIFTPIKIISNDNSDKSYENTNIVF